jgi:hypothetical protein
MQSLLRNLPLKSSGAHFACTSLDDMSAWLLAAVRQPESSNTTAICLVYGVYVWVGHWGES